MAAKRDKNNTAKRAVRCSGGGLCVRPLWNFVLSLPKMIVASQTHPTLPLKATPIAGPHARTLTVLCHSASPGSLCVYVSCTSSQPASQQLSQPATQPACLPAGTIVRPYEIIRHSADLWKTAAACGTGELLPMTSTRGEILMTGGRGATAG